MAPLLFPLLAMSTAPLAARQVELLDRFSITAGASWVEADTSARIDSEILGLGTEVDFESDLDFDESELVPSILLELQLARRHRLSASWVDVDRDSSKVLQRNVQVGDSVFPIDFEVAADLDISDYRLGYTYWPVRRERSAFGVGLGVRVLEVRVALTVEELGLFENRDVTGPLPFLGLEYRRGLGSRARLLAELGVFALEIDDISGEQYLARVGVEHLTFDHVGFGAAVALSRLDADTKERRFRGTLELDFVDITAFTRVRW